jgi:bifunctional DNA-binding transcriptional regulator/antitoxin component of YhaV-PrlF toxin-antitoxin module
MYYDLIMNMIMSISSRGLVYFPDKLQKRLKLKKPGKFSIVLTDDNKIELKSVKDISEFAGKAKIKAPRDFDYRKYMEENFNEMDRL